MTQAEAMPAEDKRDRSRRSDLQGRPETVRVDLGARSYDVRVGPGMMDLNLVRDALPGRRAAIVVDNFINTTCAGILSAWRDCVFIPVAGGEASKSFSQLQQVVEALLEARLERDDVVVALGGGVVGDLAGFAAAITRRGTNFVQMPTTLLAQVDASVGGKTGINTRYGKNLVGAFHQPRLVLADTTILGLLPPREFRAGYAEMVKHGLIGDASYFASLEADRDEIFAGGPARVRAIAESVRFKARIVAADEREGGERALLNLGHTFGHALEAACGFDNARLIHGEAVAIGVVLAHEFSTSEGLAPAADIARVREHFAAVGLPTRIGDIPGGLPSAAELVGHMAQDKKVKGGRLTFILTRGIGRAFIANDVPAAKVQAFLERCLAA